MKLLDRSTVNLILPFSLFALLHCGLDSSTNNSHRQSAHNGYKCDISYNALSQNNLAGIRINDLGISQSEKIRHLNELNSLPFQFLQAYREHNVSINLANGGVTLFPEFRQLKGVNPPEWAAMGVFDTWDNIPGTGDARGVYLGNSALNNDTFSLAMHEGSHALDDALGFTRKVNAIQSLLQKMKSAGNNREDRSWSYRTLNSRWRETHPLSQP